MVGMVILRGTVLVGCFMFRCGCLRKMLFSEE